MNNFTLIIISISLAMDAFAVSISEGIAMKRKSIKYSLIVGLLFGLFQAFMPLIGWEIGKYFYSSIFTKAKLISFLLILAIGCKMIYEAYDEDKCEKEGICRLSGDLILLAIATSIDALAIGFSFALNKNLNIVKSVTTIGIITFAISFSGVLLGNKIGNILSNKAEYFGGFILIGIAFKTLLM